MKRWFLKYIALTFLITIANKSFCQLDSLDILTNNKNTQTEKAKVDTLLTYVFGDWHKNTFVFSWTHNPYFNTVSRVPIKDTLPDDVRIEYPFFKKDAGAVFLGTPGNAAITHDFFQRKTNEYFKFFEPYDIYTFDADNVLFFNTKRPFTVLSYQTSGSRISEESNIRVVHTQNINPRLNFALVYQRYGTRGQYINEATDNKLFGLSTNYTGKRYLVHAAYTFNNIANRENGGISNDRDITDTIITSEDIDVRLTDAHNKLRKQTFIFTHSLGIPVTFFNKQNRDSTKTKIGEGTLIYLGNSLEYTTYRRLYTDTKNGSNDYYDNWYYNAERTRDSSHTAMFDLKVFASIQPWASDAIISKIAGGIGYRNQNYYGFNPEQYLTNINTTSENDLYFYASANGKFNKYLEWNGYTRYFFTGKTNFTFDGNLRVSLYPIKNGIHLKGRFLFQHYEPNFFEKHYYSNHIIWNNDFSPTTRTQIEGSISIPDLDLEIGAKQALIQNYIYNDTLALPRQHSGNLSVTSFFIRKNFKLGLFRFDNEVLMQISGNANVLPLPKISAHASWYLQAVLVKSVLTAQIGLDVRYNTRYYAYAYNPALGNFHTQAEREIGNFPYTEAFANFKWKRTVIFVKMTNIFKDTCGSEYFAALHYPRNNTMLLRLGLTWHFFN
jgi:hypothetical protein